MEHPGFFDKAGPFQLTEICSALDKQVPTDCDTGASFGDVKPLDQASSSDITFFENSKLIDVFKSSKAGACLVTEEFAEQAPANTIPLLTDNPQRDFASIIELFYPSGTRSQVALSSTDLIAESAVIEEGADIEPGVIIGPEAHIGSGTRIAAGSVIGYRTYIGRNCMLGPNATVTHSLIGNNVTVHAGTAIGQDGFGYVMGPEGHKKIPQIGRVIIQDNVEIGANTTIDRGALTDTIIGEGTKIDNLVQIAHNVVIGCHAVIVSQAGLSGSTKIEDFVAMGGQTGTVGHITIGKGSQIAASSKVHKDVPAGRRYGGTPAKPMRQWFKEIVALERLAEQPKKERQS